ncbi:MAG: hypothetical protein ACRC68_04725, partial [Clostridium sp.]
MDIKLKSSYQDIIMKNKLKNIVIWIVRVIAIISFILVVLISTDYKGLKLIIILLIYKNIILFLEFLANQFRTFAVWKFIDKSISKIENSNTLEVTTIENDYTSNGFEGILGSDYGEVVEYIKRILKVINTGVKNT